MDLYEMHSLLIIKIQTFIQLLSAEIIIIKMAVFFFFVLTANILCFWIMF